MALKITCVNRTQRIEILEIKIKRDFLDTIYGLHIFRNVICRLDCAVS